MAWARVLALAIVATDISHVGLQLLYVRDTDVSASHLWKLAKSVHESINTVVPVGASPVSESARNLTLNIWTVVPSQLWMSDVREHLLVLRRMTSDCDFEVVFPGAHESRGSLCSCSGDHHCPCCTSDRCDKLPQTAHAPEDAEGNLFAWDLFIPVVLELLSSLSGLIHLCNVVFVVVLGVQSLRQCWQGRVRNMMPATRSPQRMREVVQEQKANEVQRVHRGPLEPFGRPRQRKPQFVIPEMPAQLARLATGGGLKRKVGAGEGQLPALIVVHDPDEDSAPHCLFSCASYIMTGDTSMTAILFLRHAVQGALQDIHDRDAKVCGATVGEWATCLGFQNVQSYIEQTGAVPYRKGSTVDLHLMSLIYDTQFWMYNAEAEVIYKSHEKCPWLSVLHTCDHFQVVQTPVLRPPSMCDGGGVKSSVQNGDSAENYDSVQEVDVVDALFRFRRSTRFDTVHWYVQGFKLSVCGIGCDGVVALEDWQNECGEDAKHAFFVDHELVFIELPAWTKFADIRLEMHSEKRKMSSWEVQRVAYAAVMPELLKSLSAAMSKESWTNSWRRAHRIALLACPTEQWSEVFPLIQFEGSDGLVGNLHTHLERCRQQHGTERPIVIVHNVKGNVPVSTGHVGITAEYGNLVELCERMHEICDFECVVYLTHVLSKPWTDVSETEPFEDHEQNVDLATADERCIAHVVQGGASDLVKFPAWPECVHSHLTEHARLIHVSTPNEEHYDVTFPMCSRDAVEGHIAKHLAVLEEWLDFCWESSRHVRVAWKRPPTAVQILKELQDATQTVLRKAKKRARTQTHTVVLGLRTTRQRGVTAITVQERHTVSALNMLLRQHVPDATWTSIAVVQHEGVPAHTDSMNSSHRLAFIVTLQGNPQIWLPSELGTETYNGVQGSWRSAAPGQIVLYMPRRQITDEERALLQALEFPSAVQAVSSVLDVDAVAFSVHVVASDGRVVSVPWAHPQPVDSLRASLSKLLGIGDHAAWVIWDKPASSATQLLSYYQHGDVVVPGSTLCVRPALHHSAACVPCEMTNVVTGGGKTGTKEEMAAVLREQATRK
eukprot:6490477-Amphidinium_carterae.1